jgi:hypothetical protein
MLAKNWGICDDRNKNQAFENKEVIKTEHRLG